MWEILGIAPTRDIKEIKSAYARLAKQFNPEENPEEFKRIFEAYKAACRYARNGGSNSGSGEIRENLTASKAAGNDGTFDFSAAGQSDSTGSENEACASGGFDFSKINADNIGMGELSENEKRKMLLKNIREIISDDSRRNNTEMWLDFFVREELDDFIYEPEFRKEAANLFFGMLFSPEAALIIASGFGRGSGMSPINYYPVRECGVIISEGGHKPPDSEPITSVYKREQRNFKKYKPLIIFYIVECLIFVAGITAFFIWDYTSRH